MADEAPANPRPKNVEDITWRLNKPTRENVVSLLRLAADDIENSEPGGDHYYTRVIIVPYNLEMPPQDLSKGVSFDIGYYWGCTGVFEALTVVEVLRERAMQRFRNEKESK